MATEGFSPFNFFRTQPNPASPTPSAAPTPTPAPNPQNTANGRMEQPNLNAGPGTDQNNPNISGQPNDPNARVNEPNSPLDAFKDLFTIDPNKKPVATTDPLKDKLFNLDPAKLSETAKKMDFARAINPELAQKAIGQGGDVQAFNGIINDVGRAIFSMLTQMNVGMMENGISRNNDRFSSVLDNRFRTYQVNNSETKNPALKHPAAQPVLAAIRNHIAEQNPNLLPQEVSAKAEEYFTAMGAALGSLNKEGGGTGTGAKPSEPDYSMFLSS